MDGAKKYLDSKIKSPEEVKTLFIRCDVKTYKDIKKLASRNEISLNKTVIHAINYFVESYKKGKKQ